MLLYGRGGIGLAPSSPTRCWRRLETARGTWLGFAADLGDYGIGAQILADLGLKNIDLLTNNPRKIVGLEAYGLRIHRRVPIQLPPTRHNRRYLAAKRDKLGHLLDLTMGET